MADATTLGLEARMRTAGMAALLAEIRNSNYARDMDQELLDRIDRAIEDQALAREAASGASGAGKTVDGGM